MSWLERLYSRDDGFYVLIMPNGTFVVESPDTQFRLQEQASLPVETLIRMFCTAEEAVNYSNLSSVADIRIVKVTLPSLWNLLPRIDALSLAQFGIPVAIEVSSFQKGVLRTIDTLRTTLATIN